MEKMNCNSFNRSELDIIDKYSKKENKLFFYLMCSFLINIFMNTILDDSMLSNIILVVLSVLLAINFICYIYFIVRKQSSIISEIKNNRRGEIKI